MTSQASLDSSFALSVAIKVEVEWFTLHSSEVYFKIIFLQPTGACGDLWLDLICGELIEVNVVEPYPDVFSQICKSDLKTCVAATGLRVLTPLGIMCFSNNLRQLMLLAFFISMP